MSTKLDIKGSDLDEQADQEAVLQHAFQGTPLDSDVVRRVRERSVKVTKEIRRLYGIIDDATFEALLRDDEP
jgi:hypothetical protein